MFKEGLTLEQEHHNLMVELEKGLAENDEWLRLEMLKLREQEYRIKNPDASEFQKKLSGMDFTGPKRRMYLIYV